MEQSTSILSDITIYSKYARYLKKEKRREDWSEIVDRNKNMHINKFPELKEEIEWAYSDVYKKKILPSMRSLQFAGASIERNPARIYNCAYMPIDHTDSFSELMFLLLGGTGVGYSVQYRHINLLPDVVGVDKEERRYVVGDSIEGWADAIKVLVESHFYGKETVRFDYGDIREKGTELVTSGGKAPGPQPLRMCLTHLDIILRAAKGRKLKPIEVHDMCCFIADAVLAGGIRRAALISLFSKDDKEMMNAKVGAWWELNPQRSRANNSVILLRNSVDEEEFFLIWERIKASGSGEPGIYWTNDLDWGTNPCCEIALRPYQFCNLVEINASTIIDYVDFKSRAVKATCIATLQASYTDFHYLRPIWKKTTEEDALIGVGITGIASNRIKEDWLEEVARCVGDNNIYYSMLMCINPASRTTTVKPSGTSSLVVGSSSGIHAYHNDYYLRRLRFKKDEPIWRYLSLALPELCEDEFFDPTDTGVVSIPQMAPEGSIIRTESVFDLLARVGAYNSKWARRGYYEGKNSNNVSATISIKEGEWEKVGQWMYDNKWEYNGISVLPYDGGTYKQAPFEDITKEQYEKLSSYLKKIDLKEIIEEEDNTELTSEAACAGGQCELPF